MEEKKNLSTKDMLQNLKNWAQLLRISDDRLEILSGISEPERMGAVFYGLIVQTPVDELVHIMDENKDTDGLFMQLQLAFMRRCRNNDEIYEKIDCGQNNFLSIN